MYKFDDDDDKVMTVRCKNH